MLHTKLYCRNSTNKKNLTLRLNWPLVLIIASGIMSGTRSTESTAKRHAQTPLKARSGFTAFLTRVASSQGRCGSHWKVHKGTPLFDHTKRAVRTPFFGVALLTVNRTPDMIRSSGAARWLRASHSLGYWRSSLTPGERNAANFAGQRRERLCSKHTHGRIHKPVDVFSDTCHRPPCFPARRLHHFVRSRPDVWS